VSSGTAARFVGNGYTFANGNGRAYGHAFTNNNGRATNCDCHTNSHANSNGRA
jgi:hypothetical protein